MKVKTEVDVIIMDLRESVYNPPIKTESTDGADDTKYNLVQLEVTDEVNKGSKVQMSLTATTTE